MTIRNPIEWSLAHLKLASDAAGSAGRTVHPPLEDVNALAPAIRRIGLHDLRAALEKGFADFAACRSDVIFLSLVYPVIGLVLARAALQQDMLPLLFPLAAGFALIGPFAAIGLYEMSRRREQGIDVAWTDAFAVLGAPSWGGILTMGLALTVIFVCWLLAAQAIYAATLGPAAPASMEALLRDALTTGPGWALIGWGVGVGFLFAVLVLSISVVSFPLLVDRNVGVATAVWTSLRAVAANPGPMAVWGLIVAAGLVLGSIPLFVGLIVVMPVLGHATWHLYRRLLPR